MLLGEANTNATYKTNAAFRTTEALQDAFRSEMTRGTEYPPSRGEAPCVCLPGLISVLFIFFPFFFLWPFLCNATIADCGLQGRCIGWASYQAKEGKDHNPIVSGPASGKSSFCFFRLFASIIPAWSSFSRGVYFVCSRRLFPK